MVRRHGGLGERGRTDTGPQESLDRRTISTPLTWVVPPGDNIQLVRVPSQAACCGVGQQ